MSLTGEDGAPSWRQRFLADEAATMQFGAQLAGAVHAILGEDTEAGVKAGGKALMIHLQGDLGAGKTTLSRGVLRALGHQAAVKSPTYTLVEPYEHLKFPVYHFDLYRLSDPEEVEFLGVESYFEAGRLCLVEWPDNGRGVLPEANLVLQLVPADQGRLLRWRGIGEVGMQLERELSDRLAEYLE